MLGKELSFCLQAILAASRRSQQVHKTAEALLKTQPTGDQLGQLLQQISQTKNKKMYEIGLRLIEASQNSAKIDFEYIFSFLDTPNQKDSEILFRQLRQLQNMLNSQVITAVFFQKMYNYFMTTYSHQDSRLKQRAKYCLYSLFQIFFSQQRQQYRSVLLQLLNQLTYMNSQLLFQLMVKVDGVITPQYSDNFIESTMKSNNTLNQVFTLRDDPAMIALFFHMVYKFPQASNINLVLQAILRTLPQIRYHNSRMTIVMFIKDEWFRHIIMMEKMYKVNPRNITLLGRIIKYVEETLSKVCQNGVKDPLVQQYQTAIYSMLIMLGESLNIFMDIKAKLQSRKFIRPLDEQLLVTKKATFYRHTLDQFGQPVSRMLATLCKWSSFQYFKQLIKHIEQWIDRCGLFRSQRAMCCFLKSAAYLSLPKKGTNVITDKNLRSIRLLLDTLYLKIYLLDITSLTLVLKVFQALEQFFCIEGTLTTADDLAMRTQGEQEILNDFNIVKESIKQLFNNSNELSNKLISIFFDSLTQVALDSFEKAQQSRYNFKYLIFALQKTGRIVLNNIPRIVDFRQPFMNFMLIHLHSSDIKIGEVAAEIFCKTQLKIAQYLTLNRKSLDQVFKSLYDAACSSPYIQLLNWIMDCLTKLTEYDIQQNILTVCQTINKIWPKSNQKTLMCAQQCLLNCIEQLKPSTLKQARQVTQTIRFITSMKRQQLQYQDWKITGNLLLKLTKIISSDREQQFKSDDEDNRRSLGRIQHNLSQRHSTIQDFQQWLQLTKETMGLILELFLDSQYVFRKNYIQIFSSKFFNNSHGFRYRLIYDVMLPVFCKMLLKIVDYSLVGAIVVETPNFRVGEVEVNSQAEHWKDLLQRFINTVWNKIAQIIAMVDTKALTLVSTLFTCLSHSMTKKCISVSLVLMENLMHLMQQLPQTTNICLIVHLPALYVQFHQLVQIIQSVSEHVQFIESLHKLSQKIIPLLGKFPTSLQVSTVMFCLMLQTNRSYYNLKYQYDYATILQSVSMETLSQLSKMSKMPQSMKEWVDKLQKQRSFMYQLRQSLKHSDKMPENQGISEVYGILLTMKPEMPQGLITFLKNAGHTIRTAEQQLQILVTCLKILLEKKSNHYTDHLSLITDALLNHPLKPKILQQLNQIKDNQDVCCLFQKIFQKALTEKQQLTQVFRVTAQFQPIHKLSTHISHNYHTIVQILSDSADQPQLVIAIAQLLKQLRFQ